MVLTSTTVTLYRASSTAFLISNLLASGRTIKPIAIRKFLCDCCLVSQLLYGLIIIPIILASLFLKILSTAVTELSVKTKLTAFNTLYVFSSEAVITLAFSKLRADKYTFLFSSGKTISNFLSATFKIFSNCYKFFSLRSFQVKSSTTTIALFFAL